MSAAVSVSASRPDPLCRKWWVRVGEATYGPYTGRQIRDFIAERRVISRSVIRPVSGGSWRRACDDEILGKFFPTPKSKRVSQSKTVDATRKTHKAARTLRRLLTEEDPAPAEQAAVSDTEAAKPADVLVFANAAAPGPGFEVALDDLGAPIQILSGAWLLRTDLSADKVRERLGPVLGQAAQLVVVDVTRQQTATLNLGSDLDVQIRQRLDTFA